MIGTLYLEDGSVYRGMGFGAAKTNVGELVFNTSMSGYQEMLTDPAVTGQIVNMTYPLIGNYGVSAIDNQSERVHAFGLVAHDISFRPSNRCSEMSISEWLETQGTPGVYNVDTRAITKKIRANGTCKCVISTEEIATQRAQELIENTKLREDYMKDAGVKARLTEKGNEDPGAPGKGLTVAVLDFGAKRGTVRAITSRGCDAVLFPYGSPAEEIMSIGPDGILLPDGPGSPEECKEGVQTAAGLIRRLPVFGVGLGHLIIALAAGGRVYKLKYGHRGSNHGVLELETDKSAITSQNHGFAVDADSFKYSGFSASHINLNDGTVEGLKHEKLPVFSAAFLPEGGPGPNDSEKMYDRFVETMLAFKSGGRIGGDANA